MDHAGINIMNLRRLNTSIAVSLLFLGGCASLSEKQFDVDTAMSYFDSGDVEGGYAYLERSMEKDPTSLEISNLYRQMAVKNRQQDYAIEYFKTQVEDTKVVDETFYNLAFAYIDKIPTVGPMGSGFLSKKAIAQFQHVLDRDATDWVAVYGIGMNYLHWPDYFKKNESAVEYLEKAKALQKDGSMRPYYILTYIRLGDAYAKIGEIDKAYETWQEGIALYPGHGDLEDRLSTPRSDVNEIILSVYNPNNSIGEINTDISVLWEETVPESLVPLKRNPLKQGGVGGLLRSAGAAPDGENIGLFSWFMRNLPFLSDKGQFASVDMSALGIAQANGTSDLASKVAHGMILGFVSQFEEDTALEAQNKSDRLQAFSRPFFHEGLGMGYAATASLEDPKQLETLIAQLKKIDPKYTRLHLAGAGMWYGLESNNIEKVQTVFSHLGEFGKAYAYEGYGFAQTLFYYKSNPEILRIGETLDPVSASTFYHGAGRALWILTGNDTSAMKKGFEQIPLPFRSDASSGYGMGVAFTKIDDPEFVFSHFDSNSSQINIDEYLTGVSMGWTIRNLNDSDYVGTMVASASPSTQCGIRRALSAGERSLEAVSDEFHGDLHRDWRNKIHESVGSVNSMSEWISCQ